MSALKSFLASVLITSTLASLTAQSPTSSPASVQCREQLFRGFDSRLKPSLIGRFPTSKDAVVGFAVLGGKPAVVFSHRILALESLADITALPSFKALSGILSTPVALRVRTAGGFLRFGESGLEPARQDGLIEGAFIAQDSTPNAVMAVQHGATAEFTVLTPSGTKLPIASISGQLHSVSWTTAGLAAVVGDSLFTFGTGEDKFRSTPPDTAFKTAVGLCMVGPSRAVVIYPHTAVLYDHGLRSILVAINDGRCAFDGKALYLLDTGNGLVWRVDDLAAVGSAASTRDFIRQRIEIAKTRGGKSDLAYREVARLIGFDEASTLAGRMNPCPAVAAPAPAPPSVAPKSLKTRPNL